MTTGLSCHCEEAFRPTKQSVISINDLDVKQYQISVAVNHVVYTLPGCRRVT